MVTAEQVLKEAAAEIESGAEQTPLTDRLTAQALIYESSERCRECIPVLAGWGDPSDDDYDVGDVGYFYDTEICRCGDYQRCLSSAMVAAIVAASLEVAAERNAE